MLSLRSAAPVLDPTRAAEQRDLTRSNIKHLVRRIRKGNWASLRIPQRSALRCID